MSKKAIEPAGSRTWPSLLPAANAGGVGDVVTLSNPLFDDHISNDRMLACLSQLLIDTYPKSRELYLVGGALRDPQVSANLKPKDIDMVIDDPSVSTEELLCLPEAQTNFFGGVTFCIRGVAIDIWPLKDTYHIQRFSLPCDASGLLGGAPLSTDKIAYGFRQKLIYDCGGIASLVQRTIGYAPTRRYLEHIQAARAILLRQKTEFAFDASTREMLTRASDSLISSPSRADELKDYLRISGAAVSYEQICDQILCEGRTSKLAAANR